MHLFTLHRYVLLIISSAYNTCGSCDSPLLLSFSSKQALFPTPVSNSSAQFYHFSAYYCNISYPQALSLFSAFHPCIHLWNLCFSLTTATILLNLSQIPPQKYLSYYEHSFTLASTASFSPLRWYDLFLFLF